MKWIPISKFNIKGKHEGVRVIVWDSKTKEPRVDFFYSSCPSNLFSNGTYTHFMIAPKEPK